ncbi:MAG TPA: hypothetical protein VN688_02290 [Gemmataceae bacterium]|nr:hypothetical protein [Gemmataceae bacterium]
MPMNVTCPRCHIAFTVEHFLADVPVLELADPGQPELIAEAVEDEAEGGPFDHEIERAANADDPAYTIQQRIVAALLLRALADCKPSVIDAIAAVLTLTLLLPFVVGVGFLAVVVMYYPLAWGNRLFGGGNGGLLYLLPTGLMLIVSGFKNLGQDETIKAERKGGKLSSLKLGRLHDTFAGGILTTLLMAGLLLGWQAGLLYYAPKTCDLSFEPTAGQAWLLTLDTVSFNSLLGFLDTVGAGMPQREASVWSDTIFHIFQTAYGALAALFGYQLYQRWRLRRLLDGVPDPLAGAGEVVQWVNNLCRGDRAWARLLFDEVMFLTLAALYVGGRWDETRIFARRFPWMRIAPEVRRLFLDRDGGAIFPSG